MDSGRGVTTVVLYLVAAACVRVFFLCLGVFIYLLLRVYFYCTLYPFLVGLTGLSVNSIILFYYGCFLSANTFPPSAKAKLFSRVLVVVVFQG